MSVRDNLHWHLLPSPLDLRFKDLPYILGGNSIRPFRRETGSADVVDNIKNVNGVTLQLSRRPFTRPHRRPLVLPGSINPTVTPHVLSLDSQGLRVSGEHLTSHLEFSRSCPGSQTYVVRVVRCPLVVQTLRESLERRLVVVAS